MKSGSRLAWLVAGLLAVVIGWELASPAPDDTASLVQPVPRPGLAQAPRLSDPGDQGAQQAALALARPIFSSERRPTPAGPSTARTGTALPRLTAVLTGPNGRRAIFASEPRPIIVTEGGQVGGFTVRSIEPGRVTLIGPGGMELLQPSFGPPRPVAVAAGSAGPSLAVSIAPKDGMSFQNTPAPSGLEILRNLGASSPEIPLPSR